MLQKLGSFLYPMDFFLSDRIFFSLIGFFFVQQLFFCLTGVIVSQQMFFCPMGVERENTSQGVRECTSQLHSNGEGTRQHQAEAQNMTGIN
jgi:hypothetical protein